MTIRPGRQSGQALVLFALALVAILAFTGLVVDGGTVFAQQRVAQNGSDAAALAGALVVRDERSRADDDPPTTNSDVYAAILAMANSNGLEEWTAEYTLHDGSPSGISVTTDSSPVPPGIWGVRVSGERTVDTTFSRVVGVNTMTAGAAATALIGPLSYDCPIAESPCAMMPLSFPVKIFQCDAQGNLEGGTWIGAPPPDAEGEGYWPLRTVEEMTPENLAILPLCRGSGESTGTFGFLDLDPSMNLQQEILGPLTVPVPVPGWYQTQTGNPNSVQDELEHWIGSAVLIPLHNQACRSEPPGDVCNDPGVAGNNTWYYVHTIGVFVLYSVHVQGNQVDACANPPGSPTVPVTQGTGFLGCLKGWFTEYVLSSSINPDPDAGGEDAVLGIQLIR